MCRRRPGRPGAQGPSSARAGPLQRGPRNGAGVCGGGVCAGAPPGHQGGRAALAGGGRGGGGRAGGAQVIYEKLFAWLVGCINTCLSESDALSQLVESERRRIEGRFIGVLDIFGFEVPYSYCVCVCVCVCGTRRRRRRRRLGCRLCVRVRLLERARGGGCALRARSARWR